MLEAASDPVGLLDLAFLVHHVLAYDRIEFLDFDLIGGGALVLVGGVEVTRSFRGNQADLVALGRHGRDSLDLFATGTEVGEDGVDAVLVDGAQGVGGNAQLDPALLAGDPEPALVQVRQPAAAGSVVGVGNIVAHLPALAGQLADARHGLVLNSIGSESRRP